MPLSCCDRLISMHCDAVMFWTVVSSCVTTRLHRRKHFVQTVRDTFAQKIAFAVMILLRFARSCAFPHGLLCNLVYLVSSRTGRGHILRIRETVSSSGRRLSVQRWRIVSPARLIARARTLSWWFWPWFCFLPLPPFLLPADSCLPGVSQILCFLLSAASTFLLPTLQGGTTYSLASLARGRWAF
uniref:Uncharacterized protein n=1 Tax=Parascaris univalens TaxID=6257 RepID=A0A914ZTH8_PARUN